MKLIFGLACLAAALPLGLFAWACFLASNYAGELSLKFVPAAFALGLICIGFFLVSKRCSVISTRAKAVIIIFFGLLVVIPVLLDIHIRNERKILQVRAQNFLLRPIPKLLVPDANGEVGGYYVDTNAGTANGVFGYSRVLIERYATKGRIRWSAAIQGEFACIGDNCLNGNISDEVLTNEDVRRYSAESHAILAEEWRMGFWQWIEDTIEMKTSIPEIEEEDQYNGWIDQLVGTWTNENFETMTISHNGTFSARWVSPAGTNVFIGNEIFIGASSVVRVIRDTPSHILQDGDEKDIKILHVDSHNLVYELGGQTNSMRR
ncbi:MAG TPA: hypothetical protein VN625_10345 [Desulfuromonadaceae bacterium]|nr:hypothetical protein [Desulfuromonadaceae bacterium]